MRWLRGSLWHKSRFARLARKKSSVLLHWHRTRARNPESPEALTKFDTPLLIIVLVLVVLVLLERVHQLEPARVPALQPAGHGHGVDAELE